MTNKKLSVVLLLILFHTYQVKRIKSLNYWKQKNKTKIEVCRRNLKEIYDMIETPNKFIIGGTLLGSVRSNDIIPFDDDVDIGIYVTKEDDIPEIKKQIQESSTKYNYEYKEMFFGSKCIKDKLGVDIFFFKPDGNGKTVFVSKRARKSWPNFYYYTDDLTNFEKSSISGNSYNVCRNALSHLKRVYGENWKEMYITHIHTFDPYNKQFSDFNVTNLMNKYLITILKKLHINRVK